MDKTKDMKKPPNDQFEGFKDLKLEPVEGLHYSAHDAQCANCGYPFVQTTPVNLCPKCVRYRKNYRFIMSHYKSGGGGL